MNRNRIHKYLRYAYALQMGLVFASIGLHQRDHYTQVQVVDTYTSEVLQTYNTNDIQIGPMSGNWYFTDRDTAQDVTLTPSGDFSLIDTEVDIEGVDNRLSNYVLLASLVLLLANIVLYWKYA